MNMAIEKNPKGGRPTDYDPDFCKIVESLGKAGKSIVQIACALDVHKDTVYEWEKIHPKFSDAMALARQFSQAWWEDQGQDGLRADKFQSTLWAKQVSCRFPNDYRETKDVNLGGQSDNPLKIEGSLKPEDRAILERYISEKTKEPNK